MSGGFPAWFHRCPKLAALVLFFGLLIFALGSVIAVPMAFVGNGLSRWWRAVFEHKATKGTKEGGPDDGR